MLKSQYMHSIYYKNVQIDLTIFTFKNLPVHQNL